MSISFLPPFQRSACSAALTALIMLAGASAQAQQPPQGQSMEERLRAQLRITTTQLQQAQNELAALKAGHPTAAAPGAPAAAAAPSSEAESLKKELAGVKSQLASARSGGAKLSETEAALQKANAQAAQYHTAYDDLLKLARASEAERQRLSTDTGSKQTAVAQCEAKNVKLYAAGEEILHAYETLDLSSILSSRQPFAAKTRVKYEEIAQEYGDKLYEGRFDARSVNVPAAPAAAAAAADTKAASAQ